MLNKLDNFIKNTEGRILYVSPSDLDATDAITNQGNSLAQPFKTLQRALLEAARFSYQLGNNNDIVEKTTILLMPGEHIVDNRPGYVVYNDGGAKTKPLSGSPITSAQSTLSLTLTSNFDLTQSDNILYKFNSVNGGVVVPRGTSIVGLDLRKTKLRPKYVPNPTDPNVDKSAIFRVTGACYFWQFSVFDGDESGLVYTDPEDYSVNNQSKPTFSHHKLTIFEYADGKNKVSKKGSTYDITDLDMYYSKLSNAFNLASGREIKDIDKYPANIDGFAKLRPEWEIVGAFASDPISILTIESGSGGTATPEISVSTTVAHKLNVGTPIKIRGVSVSDYNVSTKVSYVDPSDPTKFKYLLASVRNNLPTNPGSSGATVTIETDTVSGASPYIFNCSMRSIWGMNGMHSDGSKASGFRSMVVAQFTGVSLQKDDRAFVKYNSVNRDYSDNISISRVAGSSLSNGASSTDIGKVYHLDSQAIYRNGWESSHIKATNDAFIQIVSVFAIGYNKHFDSQSGSDLSITNSNSNFGQISLSASGFKKEAFAKDNKAFITSIITPRAIVSTENAIDWIPFDVAKTISLSINPSKNRLYLYGFNSLDDVPPTLTQGYRVGARTNGKIYLNVSGTEYSANTLMSDGTTSSVKEYVSAVPSSSKFSIGAHNLNTGEKVIIISDDGDLPENTVENTVYYAITDSVNSTRTDSVTLFSTEIQLASSYTNAISGTPITVYKGTNLRILSRVSDKIAGELGHPVQYDTTNGWYINTNANSAIWNTINTNQVALGQRTEPSYIKRYSDSRSLDEKLYKIRVVIPKEYANSKKPENGFVIQESSTTGIRFDTDINLSSLIRSDYDYNKNLRLIAKCTRSSSTVTIISELPHNLQVNDTVIIRNVTDSTNTTGTDDLGYNGTFTVASVVDDMSFTYIITTSPGTVFTNDTTLRKISSPRFERNDLQSNLYIYRNEVIKPYIEGVQDGIYHLYVLNANNVIDQEFTNLKYSQNVVDLYPQLDRDNTNDNPSSAKSFATRSPLGQVVTNDLRKSITRESLDSLLTSFGVGLDVSSVSNPTITFARNHGLAGVVTYSSLPGGAAYTSGTYQNVKLLNTSQTGTWQGATAKVVVSGGAVISADIVSSGSGYSAGDLFFDSATIGSGNGNARFTISISGISSAIGNVVQFTGSGIATDTYHRITSIPSATTIGIARTAGDPVITTNQYAFIVGPSVQILSSSYSSVTGITTFNCSTPHGLSVGNKFKVTDSSNNNLGDFIVNAKVGINTFTAVTNSSLSANNGYILKHGLSTNDKTSDSTLENLGARSISLFDDEILTVVSFTSNNQIRVSSPISASGIAKRFPLGSYIQIDEEIMRTISKYGVGGSNDAINVERGIFGTVVETHNVGSLIKKIKPIPVEFRRPAILRASGHTFEYLGYGPGNYSTALPQVQVKSLTEREDFLVQSQERSCGLVVYTGMNNNGDVFNGNTKTTASSGEVVSYDIPKPTVTGEDPSRLSVVYDEVTIKERLVVEGGNSRTVLSQFDGPVTFNKGVSLNDATNINAPLKITDTTNSSNSKTGALVVSGGVGISKNLNVDGSINVGGNIGFNGTLSGSSLSFGNITLAQTDANTINTTSGNLKLTALTGSKVAITTSVTINGNLDATSGSGRITANYIDAPNITPVGSIIMWPGTILNFPTGWAVCNGASLSATTYANLYNIIGTTYGGSAGVSFNLPDLRDRFIAGAGSAYSVGNTGGSDSVTLTLAQTPKHSHTITDNGHAHNITDNGHNHGFWEINSSAASGISQVKTNAGSQIKSDTTTALTGITINANGTGIVGTNNTTEGDGAHENRPPYFALIYLIKIQ